MMWRPADAARVLSACNGAGLCLSRLATELGGNRERTILLVTELQHHGLLQKTVERNRRGRPRHMLRTTALGEQFLARYDELMRIPLQSSDNDLRKAIRQAEAARRLEQQNISPYARFREVNKIVKHIASTAQTR